MPCLRQTSPLSLLGCWRDVGGRILQIGQTWDRMLQIGVGCCDGACLVSTMGCHMTSATSGPPGGMLAGCSGRMLGRMSTTEKSA